MARWIADLVGTRAGTFTITGGSSGVLTVKDTTVAAKSLRLTVDSNLGTFDELGGAAPNLFVLDLANGRAGVGRVPTSRSFEVNGATLLNDFIDITAISNPASPAAGVVRLHALTTQGFSRLEQDNEAATNITLGRDSVIIAKNTSGGPIAKGEAVYITGSTGNVPNIAKAKADVVTTLPAIGLALDDIADNNFGQVMKTGVLAAFNTSGPGWASGDVLYVSATTAGALTKTRPVSSNLAQRMGSVLVSGVGNGSILVVTAPFVGGLESGTTAASFYIAGARLDGTNGGYTTFQVSNTKHLTFIATDTYSLTVAGTASISGTNTGDQTLAGLGGAPVGSAYVTVGLDATLTNERNLQGTTNQIVLTDNGAGSTLVLSTPQNIHTAATPTFATLTLSGTAAAFTMHDTTGGAKSLRVLVDGNIAEFFEESGGARNLISLDLFGERVGIKQAPGTDDLDVLGTIKSSSTINAVTGYKVNGAAASGNYLRGDGTNFISAAILAADVPSADLAGTTNQVALSASGVDVLLGSTSITLSTPQDIHTAATPTFQSLTLSHTAPVLTMTDSTASAKSLKVTTDGDRTKFEEVGGAAANLLVLDLANGRIGIGKDTPLLSKLYVVQPSNAWGILCGDGTREAGIGMTTTDAWFGTRSNHPFKLRTNNTERWVLAADGSSIVHQDGMTLQFGTTSGSKLGSATTEKLAFYGSTPIVQSLATTDLGTVLSDLGLRAAGTAYPITTSGAVQFTGGVTITTADVTLTDRDIVLSAITGTKFGTGTTQKLSFWNAAPVARGTAFTQTYATASHTQNNITASNPPAGGTGTAAGGYDTAANRNAMITSLTNCIADVANVKQVLNGLIDDLQAIGLVP